MTETAPPSSRKPRLRDGTMRFGTFWPKAKTMLPSGKIAALNPDAMDLKNHIALAEACEAVGLDLTLIGDGYAPSSEEASGIGFQDPSLHAIILTAPLMQATKHLGIITTLHTQFFHPTQIARFGSHFDWLSGGRWGWNIVNGYRDYEASLFGIDKLPDSKALYEAAGDAVAICEGVWNGKGRVDYDGAHFRAHGKMRGPFPPERPVFVCAAASDSGRRFTAQHCDFLFASPATMADMPGVYSSLAEHSAAVGRADPPEVLALADILVRDEPGHGRQLMEDLLGSMEGEAGRKWAAQMAVLRRNQDTPEQFPFFAGTAAEVAEQIIETRRKFGVNGLLFRMPLWSAEEMLRLGPVFKLLEKAGVWVPPEKRGYSW
ncbi:LLM class flavin-dependent oxidoreductase [Rhodovarius crocodyli]|uniref:LLM class flavin-dependent oxidoreductase n=1 Tax=Rhodovarius crocodyli TaxID=1979269 RepID=A0A437MJY4_9PROT|nr:LLM class flavin-dependent oxidoreductase [Rhodovarius crocodyli]RVT97943.1 LLM class flavin-dependent oxidoreductase [Rhodovarius crocodyli]